DEFARGVMTALGTRELADDERFAHRDGRVANADTLHAMIAQWAQHRTTADATATLEAAGVPAAPVRSTAEAVRDPLVQQRGEVVQLAHPPFGPQEGLF